MASAYTDEREWRQLLKVLPFLTGRNGSYSLPSGQ